MKSCVIWGIILNIIVFLLWIGFSYLTELAEGYGSTSNHHGDVFSKKHFICLIVGVITIVCIMYSLFFPESLAKIFLWIPLICMFIGEVYINYQFQLSDKKHIEARKQIGIKNQKKLDLISRDFIFKGEDCSTAFEQSFLTYDKDFGEFYRIDCRTSYYVFTFDVYTFGKIVDGYLEIDGESSGESFYRNYVNKDGKSILDIYKFKFHPDQDGEDYHSNILNNLH